MTDEVEKLRSKLKMMEISFEQINNSRNDLIEQLKNCELIIEEIRKLSLHAGCMGNENCVLCPISRLVNEN